MAELHIKEFRISQADISRLSADIKKISIHISYDDVSPAGFKIDATGPLGSLVLCPQPCPKVNIVS